MSSPEFSLLIITRNRATELAEVLQCIYRQTNQDFELVLIDNGSEDQFAAPLRDMAERFPRVRFFREPVNHGVSGGRALGMTRCLGKVVVELDDDAIIKDEYFLESLARYLKANPSVGIVAFKIINFFTQKVSRWEFPFLQKSRDVNLPGEACWFIGCGHAIRREVIERIGIYRDYFPYSQEELDFSYRAIDAGYIIRYEPQFEVFHKKSVAGREHYARKVWVLQLKNRIKLAVLNLPWICVCSVTVLRGAYYSLLARHPLVLPRALGDLWKERQYLARERRPLGRRALSYLWKMRGPLFF
jgi:GT2 family glycosyltransferase